MSTGDHDSHSSTSSPDRSPSLGSPRRRHLGDRSTQMMGSEVLRDRTSALRAHTSARVIPRCRSVRPLELGFGPTLASRNRVTDPAFRGTLFRVGRRATAGGRQPRCMPHPRGRCRGRRVYAPVDSNAVLSGIVLCGFERDLARCRRSMCRCGATSSSRVRWSRCRPSHVPGDPGSRFPTCGGRRIEAGSSPVTPTWAGHTSVAAKPSSLAFSRRSRVEVSWWSGPIRSPRLQRSELPSPTSTGLKAVSSLRDGDGVLVG
jgi:hypothetical protein